LENEERRARSRVDIFRAKMYASDRRGTALGDRIRLNQLDRSWRLAAERLRCARAKPS
jgi:hypothetical protein